jgi:hypothetical protein
LVNKPTIVQTPEEEGDNKEEQGKMTSDVFAQIRKAVEGFKPEE